MRDHWYGLLLEVATGHIDTWDYQWSYAVWRRGGLSCVPCSNLISNVGFGPGATHTMSAESKLAGMPVVALWSPLVHPSGVNRAEKADAWTERGVFEIPARTPRRRTLKNAIRRLQWAISRTHLARSAAQ